MRVVSWLVVVASIGWLLAYHMRTSASLNLPAVNLDQVSGTALAHPNHDTAAALHKFAIRYTAAWNSQDPAQVASFYAHDGSITINGGDPHTGPAGLIQVASGFMTAFPDLDLTMVSLEEQGDFLIYHWTFSGTHAETGNRVRISGSETWRFSQNGLIAKSIGRYDPQEYERQVAFGYEP